MNRGGSLKDDIPVWEKVMLTPEEAAAYSNIGINKINELLRSPAQSWHCHILLE